MENGISTSPDLPDPTNIETDEVQGTEQRCTELGLMWVDESPEIDEAIPSLIDAELAVRLRTIPIALDEGQLVIVMLQPDDIEASDEVATITGYPVTRAGVTDEIFSELMRKYFGTTVARMAESLGGQTTEHTDDASHNLDTIEADDIHRMAEEPTLINLVNLILLEAIQSRASDVHIELLREESGSPS